MTEICVSPDPRLPKGCFEIHTANRVWFLQASSQSEVDKWIQVISQLLSQLQLPLNDNDPFQKAFTQPQAFSSFNLKDLQSRSFRSQSEVTEPNFPGLNLSQQKGFGSRGMPVGAAVAGAQVPLSDRTDLSSTESPEGWLLKQSGKKKLVRVWKKRYFIVKRSKLWYYKPSSVNPNSYDQVAGFINLSTVKLVTETVGSKNKFEIHTVGKIFQLLASSQEEMHFWVQALTHLQKESKRCQIPESVSQPRLNLNSRSVTEVPVSREATLLDNLRMKEATLQEKENVVLQLQERCTRMEERMNLWNRIAFQNWAEYWLGWSNQDVEIFGAGFGKETEEEGRSRAIRLLKRNLGDRSATCSALETEIDRLNATLLLLKETFQEQKETNTGE
eukprot:TRINITY_DN7876_c0_g1_i1.p1 TRINITY_DN7876_c0_g1~~TRINITY_DN7876_c0_g1_i1.p1  ORF type:complete len:448 (+),score=81.92 TRINITY_DN7876_c0_g1_i1:182-1345(+)